MQLRFLSNEDLHTDLQSTCLDQRKGLAEILRYLIEVDRRSLYAAMGYRSLFAYCLKELKMSENEAGPRVAVARLAKEYSWILEALAEGDVHLTGLFRLGAHIQPSNCLDLLGEARGKTVKEIDDLLAKHFPKPDVPEVLRALPHRATAFTPPTPGEPPRKSSAAERTIPMFNDQVLGSSSVAVSAEPTTSTTTTDLGFPSAHRVPSNSTSLDAPRSALSETAAGSAVTIEPTQSAQPSQHSECSTGTRSRRKEKLTPLSDTRHALQLTVSKEIREKLERARDLMSHRNRDGSFEAIVGAALDALLTKLERERFAKTTRAKVTHTSSLETPASAPAAPETSASEATALSFETAAAAAASPSDASAQRTSTHSQRSARRAASKSATTKLARSDSKQQKTRARSKALPRAVRREVFARDGEQCSFISEAGVRCDARSFLEVDHIHPKALGGDDSAANTRLLCATHNRLAAERVFGRDYVQRRIRESRAARRQKPAPRE